ncbi:gamma-glutamyl-gamma-aminobutyrate hydrolase family protein [Mycobacterium sp. smrl_JER01]|uniref:gamma-glutamyl-gamma-aminobutyrate hydrolase family protein n=1 Tax=Mycobacterium sp. smrl_JER01 TaxID=3402633 RepID=UPI003AC0798B
MMSQPPLIGISTYAVYADWVDWKANCVLTPRTYVDKISDAGGVPILLPPQISDVGAIQTVVDLVDALVLIGGEDVCGTWSGREESEESHADHSHERDRFEVALIQAAWKADLPVLGVCRGLQVLNVSRGGTLIEDLPSAGASDVHRLTRGTFNEHPVVFDSEHLSRGYYDPSAPVLSHHHQAIDVLGDGLVVVGRAEDEVIEAVEGVDRRFMIGVQWHPEEGIDGRLFRALVEAARERS